MSVRITTVHTDPDGGILPVPYCRCGAVAVENREVMGSMDYACPEGHGWVGNVRTVINHG